ncbi:acyltransferase [Bacteroidota bacterium]
MPYKQVNIIKERFQKFIQSNDMVFEFEVDCELRYRNKFPFKVIFPGVKRPLFYIRHTFARIIQYFDYSPVKVLFYKFIGIKIGKGVFIAPDVIIDVHFPHLIQIDDYALIGWGSKIFTHDFDGKTFRIGRIKIGRGAVIGGFSFVRAGVEIGEQALVKLTSTTYKDIPPYGRNDLSEISVKKGGK